MIINHNMNAMNAHRNMGINTTSAGKSMEKLSSGLRINRAGDDAAGLSISEKMRGQIRGLDQASRNAADGISMIQTAEGALQETQSIIQRMRELAVQSANDTNVTADRSAIGDELKQLTDEIERINKNTEFNEQKILDGTAGKDGIVKIHVGANEKQSMDLDFTTNGIDLTKVLEEITKADCTSQKGADEAITIFDTALKDVSKGRSQLGAYQNRLEHTINNLDNASENLTASESRVRDVDMAKEMMNFSKNNILQQAAQAMLAQANQQPQGVLQLLR